jgi:hypothetical protein
MLVVNNENARKTSLTKLCKIHRSMTLHIHDLYIMNVYFNFFLKKTSNLNLKNTN